MKFKLDKSYKFKVTTDFTAGFIQLPEVDAVDVVLAGEIMGIGGDKSALTFRLAAINIKFKFSAFEFAAIGLANVSYISAFKSKVSVGDAIFSQIIDWLNRHSGENIFEEAAKIAKTLVTVTNKES